MFTYPGELQILSLQLWVWVHWRYVILITAECCSNPVVLESGLKALLDKQLFAASDVGPCTSVKHLSVVVAGPTELTSTEDFHKAHLSHQAAVYLIQSNKATLASCQNLHYM